MKLLTNIESNNPDREITQGEPVQMMYNYKNNTINT